MAELATKYSGVQYERLLELVELNAEIVSPIAFARPVCTDPDDDKFLGAALADGVGHIVSGDKALLKLNGYKDLRIIQPALFLKDLP